MKCYIIYGLRVKSAIDLPSVMSLDNDFDVTITLGEVPTRLENPIVTNDVISVNEDEFMLTIKNVAKYYVKNGNEIIISMKKNAQVKDVTLYLLGSVFGALFMQKKRIPLHGSLVEVNGKGVMIIGESGSGKSTLSGGLVESGYRLVSDDVIITDMEDKVHVGQPSYPLQKLSKKTLDYLGIDTCSLEAVRANEFKKKYYVNRNAHFTTDSVSIDLVIDLNVVDKSESLSCNKKNGSEKLFALIKNTYRSQLVDYYDLHGIRLKQFSEIANQSVLYELNRPHGVITLNDQIRIIKNMT